VSDNEDCLVASSKPSGKIQIQLQIQTLSASDCRCCQQSTSELRTKHWHKRQHSF